jgi:hypothetical protein
MAKHVAIGVLSQCAPKDVEQKVASAGLDHARLRVITNEEESEEHVQSPINFVHVIEWLESDSLSDEMTRGTGVLPDFGGTSVPGLNVDDSESLSAFSHPDVIDHLAGVEVPNGDAEFYDDAIDDGRCVLLYTCEDGDAAKADAQAALQKAGCNHVKAF